MMRVFHHAANELRLNLAIKRRYWFESVLGLLFLVGLFCALLYSVVSVSGKSMASGELDMMIVGFVLWMFASSSYNSAANDIAEETRQRTIEHLYVTPVPFAALLGLRAVLQTVFSTILLAFGMTIVVHLTAGRMQVDVLQVLGTVLLAAPALAGVGYVVGGLLLLFKKVQVVHALMHFALISLVALPAYPVNALALLPYSLAAAVVKAAARGAEIDPGVYGLIAANSLAYLAVGLVLFALMEKRARRLGVLGHW